jgi:TonB-linked SusC/RagA family outer membrane protein
MFSQNTYSGSVTDAGTSETLIGVTLKNKITNEGTASDVEGGFSVSGKPGETIEVSYIGYQTKSILLGDETTLSIQLEAVANDLDEVIVTAFGLEKAKKASGFSFTEVSGEELTTAREVTLGAQLIGKVAGLEITKPSNGPAGSTRIIIRGISQFSGDNRPLIVIDGIPADNTNIASAGLFGGRDTGDGLSGLSPDDIENITVLKGPSAAALYGSRAGNGVLLVTTKKGISRKGLGVEISSNFVSEDVALVPAYQQQYGQGANGLKPTTQQEAFDNWRSWGARLDGSEYVAFNGETLPYSAVGRDDQRNFYQRGQTFTNTVALSGGTEKISSRLSISRLDNKGIIPNNSYARNTILLTTTAKIHPKITLSGKANYIVEEADNRTDLTDNPSNPSKYFTIGPANLPQSIFQRTRDDTGAPIFWSNNPFTLSPYWGPNEQLNADEKTRTLGYVSARYEILDWLSLQGRAAIDDTVHDFLGVSAVGTQFAPEGSIFRQNYRIKERNFDFILSATPNILEEFDFEVNLGATRTDRSNSRSEASGSRFINPGFISINNLAVRNPGTFNFSSFRLNGLFANTAVGYKDFLYLDLSARQDFFSVLTNPRIPEESNNVIGYGSGALSFVFSEISTLPKEFTFGKLRLGYGTSGFGQISPYSQLPTYTIGSIPKETPAGNVPLANIGSDQFVNPSLEPSRTTSIEIGTDLRFFRNRLGIDFTWYRQRTDRHIFPSPLPASTGFTSYQINAGEVQNQGIELLINGDIIQTSNWNWNASVNFTRNRNEVISLNEGTDQLNLGVDRLFSSNIVAEVGGQIGDIKGNVYQRNDAGLIVHDDDGLPIIAEERQVLGNFTPDWYGGITNTISFKGISFSFLIDAKQGGEILSTTSGFGYLFGTGKRTLEGRDSPDFLIVGQGVNEQGEPNTKGARIDDYYGRVSAIAAENVWDASYIKLRQITLGYQLSPKLLSKLPFTGATISVVARNVLFFQNGLDELGLDPESIYTANGGDVGIEYASLPSTRTFGANLNLKF